nr:D-alanyl-D-alanine carboxypeptidase [Cyclobacteriaceae bacterium]
MNRILFLVVLTIVYGCSSVSRQKLTKTLRETETQFQDHTGFVLYDIKRKKTVYSFNGEKYFIPASNTKIFTFYTSLSILGDSIPGLYYLERGDSLLFWGTGDPSLLYEPVQSSRVLKFLNNFSGSLYFSNSNFETTPLGPGWAWSDYLY